MTLSEKRSLAGKKGFQALADKYFSGDRERAKRYVACLGRASYFSATRPVFARTIMSGYAHVSEKFRSGLFGDIVF